MKALLCKEFGTPDKLLIEEIASPKAGAGQVVISVKACSANFPDVLMIQNLYQFKPPLPFSVGGEVAGIIKEVGEGVKHLSIGDKVIALCGWGGFAEEVVVDARRCVPLPVSMDFTVGASLLYNYGTSYHALKDRAGLKSGETLLVLGAAGGVGLAAVELGKLMGAKVIAAASTEEKLAVCKEKGADFLINYSKEDLKEKIKEITEGRGVELVYDPIGDRYTEPALRSMAWKGRYLVVGFAGGEIPKVPLNLALLKGCAIVGVFWGSFTEKETQKSRENLIELANFYAEGKINPHIYKTYSLNEAPQALWDLMNRKVIGKAVILIDQPSVVAANLSAPKNEKQEVPYTQTEKGVIFHQLSGLKSFKGKALGTSDWLVVSQEMINNFAKATLDSQWIHLDEERARKESPFGKTIAHGLLTLSLMPQFLYQLLQIEEAKMSVNYGSNKVRFITPVPAGSRIRMKATLKEVEEAAQGIKLFIDASIELEGAEKPACVAELISLVY
ncbi:zinc-binding dehydrogenase [Thermoflexibacter ruber]|uniref:NADPH:quinone reductase n=1 Tax=Thermoflexibacter ruber TaxID=1003 RepID=A0A1I2IPR0_9BACT|nr:zinc-binding dehydrogenase [Thermoflexibacter ruber]SFF42501.1 NADPH:quinone reductase [Thermoflexibacter ruber]